MTATVCLGIVPRIRRLVRVGSSLMALRCPSGSQLCVGRQRWTQDAEPVRALSFRCRNASTATRGIPHIRSSTSISPLSHSGQHIPRRNIRANAAISTVQAPSDEEVRQVRGECHYMTKDSTKEPCSRRTMIYELFIGTHSLDSLYRMRRFLGRIPRDCGIDGPTN